MVGRIKTVDAVEGHVLRGSEGCGKGTLARALKRILGQHALAISHSKHLTGNFNAHLRDCVFLFADEAFYAGDKAHDGELKAIITEPTLTIEAKYQNAIEVPNYLHLMMASNEAWVVPTSLEARRFAVFEVNGSRTGDFAWFKAIEQEMESGGYEAMLSFLQHVNLDDFDVRRIPATEGLQTQKKLSLTTERAWWYDCLHRGFVFQSRFGLEDYFSEWHETVATDLLYASYSDFASKRHERQPLIREHLGAFLRSLGAEKVRPRDTVVGEHLADVETRHGGTTRKAQLLRRPRKPAYRLGTLGAARAGFAKATGLAFDWLDEDDAAAA